MKRLLLSAFVNVLAVTAFGQVSSRASIPISLRIPSSITLSLHAVPVQVTVADHAQQPFAAPLQLSWNVNPQEIPSFRVVAYFRNTRSALFDSSQTETLSAWDLTSRWGNGDLLPFSSDGTLTLFHTTILPGTRKGHVSAPLELKIKDEALASLDDGSYQGVLYLEVRNY